MKTLLSSAALLLFVSALPPFSRAAELASRVVHREEIAALQAKAIESTRNGKIDDAIKCYQRWSQLEPENPLILKDLMRSLWERDRSEEAGAAARAVLVLRPEDLDALDMLARVPSDENRAVMEKTWRAAVKRGQVRDMPGLAMHRKLAALAPAEKAAGLLLHFCQGLHSKGKYEEGLEAARYLVERQPGSADNLNWLGKSEEATGDSAAALKTYRNSLAIDPDQPLVSVAIAGIYVNMGEYTEAKDICLALDKAGKLPAKGYLVMALSLSSEKQYEAARPWWEKAVQAYPDAVYYQYREALNLSMLGKTAEALARMRALYERSGSLNALTFLADEVRLSSDTAGITALLEKRFKDLKPGDEQWVRRMVKLYESIGAVDKEEKLLARFRAIAPDNHYAWAKSCAMALKKGNLDAGEQFCRRALELDPDAEYIYLRLGKAQETRGDRAAALETYRTSLNTNPDQPLVSVAIANIYINMREFARAKEICLALEKAGKLPAKGYPVMALSLSSEMQYEAAQPWWDKAIQAYPDSVYYRHLEALNLSMLGRVDEARAKMRALYEGAGSQKALIFLADDYALRGDTAGERALLEQRLAHPKPADEPLARRLAELYERTGALDQEEKLLTRFSAIAPDSQYILIKICDVDLKKGNLGAAEQFCRRALKINPYAEDIYKLLADIALLGGRTGEASGNFAKAAELNPTYPINMLGLAHYTYEDGHRQAAKALITDWLWKNKGSQVLPVLLYHGLATQPHDPMLAYPFHHSLAVFDAQMKALRDNGYTAVTQAQVEDWISGKTQLPEKSVLISFDDGRVDSFALGDPVLKKYGLKAVMFAALVNAEGTSPGYLSLKDIKKYQDTGRWEIQSHGDSAHLVVPTDPNGAKGLFLVNRAWLKDQGRLETRDEWRDRIEKDYLSSRTKLEAAMGHSVSGFAFPQGNYGQQDSACNTPEASRTNQYLVRKYFKTAYTQDADGMNTRTRDPWHLTRVEPGQDWKEAELMRHFSNTNPFARSYKVLMDWAAWEGHPREAYRWLKELKAQGASEGELLTGEAHIYLAQGNTTKGLELAGRAAELERTPGALEILSSGSVRGMLSWIPSFSRSADSESRRSWAIDQSLEAGYTGEALWALRHVHGEYRQDKISTAIDNGGGVSVEMPLTLFQRFRGELLAHSISGKGKNTWSGAGALYSSWTDDFKTQLRLKRALYNTALSLNENITVQSAEALADWDLDGTGLWKASGYGLLSALSDSNRRLTARAGISRSVPGTVHVRGIYRVTYDDMKNDRSGIYYSPRGVLINALGAEVSFLNHPSVKWTLSYLPALTFERGKGAMFNNEVNAALLWHAGKRLDLIPGYSYFSAANYSNSNYYLQGEFRF